MEYGVVKVSPPQLYVNRASTCQMLMVPHCEICISAGMGSPSEDDLADAVTGDGHDSRSKS